MWENVRGECKGYGEVCWGRGVGKGLEGLWESEEKCAGVWGGGEERCGKCGEMLEVCWGVGKIKGNEEKSVRGMGKVWQSVLGGGEVWGVWEIVGERCWKVCWGFGKVRGNGKSVKGREKCCVRRKKVCWDVGKVREKTGCGEVLGKVREGV